MSDFLETVVMAFKAVLFALFMVCIFGVFIAFGYWLVYDPVQEAANEVPRVMADVDGCKVYQFKSNGSWHYFTRCEAVKETK